MKLFSEAAKITLPMAAAKLFDLVTIPLNYTPSVTLSLSHPIGSHISLGPVRETSIIHIWASWTTSDV